MMIIAKVAFKYTYMFYTISCPWDTFCNKGNLFKKRTRISVTVGYARELPPDDITQICLFTFSLPAATLYSFLPSQSNESIRPHSQHHWMVTRLINSPLFTVVLKIFLIQSLNIKGHTASKKCIQIKQKSATAFKLWNPLSYKKNPGEKSYFYTEVQWSV